MTKITTKPLPLTDKTKCNIICQLPIKLQRKITKSAEARYQRVDTLMDYIINSFYLEVPDMLLFTEGNIGRYSTMSEKVKNLFTYKEETGYVTYSIVRNSYSRLNQYKIRYPNCNKSFILKRMIEKYFNGNNYF